DRVAVGRGARDIDRADIAAGSGNVLDIELLAQPVGQLLGEEARHHVGRPARREGDDDLDRVIGVSGRASGAKGYEAGKCDGGGKVSRKRAHRSLPGVFSIVASLRVRASGLALAGAATNISLAQWMRYGAKR